MKREWTAHLKTTEEKKEFKEALAYSHRVLARVNEMLGARIVACQADRRSRKTLEAHNYHERQADCNATERTLIEIVDLLSDTGAPK